MIYIFKTTVFTEYHIQLLKPHLDKLANTNWNFDLEDCDKILRIETLCTVSEQTIISLLKDKGFYCELLLY